MKQSRYTLSAKGAGEEHLLYHTASGTFAVADEETWRAWRSLPAEGTAGAERPGPAAHADATQSTDQTREAIAQLAAAGFAVADDADELGALHAAYRAAQQDRRTLALCLAPTYACNLRCPYCYEKDNEAPTRIMDDRVVHAVGDFVQAVHERDGFSRLEVQWYGGDPSLALGAVEDISRMLMTWCAQHDVEYAAMMLSNCARIDDTAADLLVRCAVEEVLVTIDGPEAIHNVRRPAADGSNSFDGIMRAVDALKSRGIRINALINLDKKTAPLLDALHDELLAEHGIDLKPTKLNDYHGTYGCNAFAAPAFNLFTHEEYAHFTYERFAAQPHTPDDYAALLAPAPLFCRGQMENYYGIDAEGDVYKCDGWMGDGRHVLLNLLDGYDAGALDTAPAYPFDDARCTACALLPICKGTCQWERTCCGEPCHPLKTTIGDYLRDWYACIEQHAEEAEPHSGLRVLHTLV